MQSAHDLVMFDLDGTLSDPLVGISRSINYVLAHFGHAQLEPHELAVHIGAPLDQVFAHITGIQSASQLSGFVAKYRERYGQVGYSENVLYPGIAEVLETLNAADISLAVCTSKQADIAEQILQMFGLRSYFRFVSGGEIGIQKWQQVESLMKLGLVSSSTVIVGDRAVDIAAAHRNGLYAGGVLWGHGSRQELESERPRYLFSAPVELCCFVGDNDQKYLTTKHWQIMKPFI